MFTIDLLKGLGVPIKSKPGGRFLVAFSFIVPVVFASVVFGNYLHNRIVIVSQKEQLENYEIKISDLRTQLEFREEAKQQRNDLHACRKELADSIHRQVQWSPVLEALLQNLPESAIVEQLEVKSQAVSRKVLLRGSLEETINITIPKRTLETSIRLDAQDNADEMVEDFTYQLYYSPLLAGKINDVAVVERIADERSDTILYKIYCIFEIK